MKKTVKWVLVAFAVLALAMVAAGCGGQKEAGKETPKENSTENQKYVFGSDTAYAPFESMDNTTGKLVGFDVDLIDAINETANISIEIKGMNFDGLIPALETGSIDGAISAMTITDKRKESVNFSVPYYLSGQSVAVRMDNEAVKGFDDLKGKKLGVQIATTGADEARKVPDAVVTDYNTINEAFLALKTGAVEAVVNDYPVSAYYIKQNPDAAKIVGDLRTSEHYGIAFPKKNTELLEKVNAALNTLKENGKYAEIYKKWFGQDPPAYLPGEPTS
ncbi:glutamine ABC transporter [Desulfocucumis palustris]|uniref:Glutamine ABC transporter n=1 Tax=Desulfocucumis palustris TaxID=1898651 RepID=A0A2L2XBH2_9FIRM|nr:basic amino acid ABC transporter substrate-binding protein [Desulfocucumis palustris]GBF33558.1 glutamine ABC transporter [Desulfocucumis palustris]